MDFKNIILSFLCTAFLLSALPASGQDLIAKQAPIDRRLKSVDSVTLKRLIEKEEINDYSEDLYTASWNNSQAHPYSQVQMPDSFRIDLRGFCMPTPSRNVTSLFGYRPAFRRQHKGLDIKVYVGDTIRAAFDGKVRVSRCEGLRKGYGNYIVLRHNNGLETIYGHLSERLVDVDQEVKAGDVIGLGGNTGRSFGSHLHFETRFLGEALNPALLFDFANQDVTGDYYVYHRNRTTYEAPRELAANNNAEEEAAPKTTASRKQAQPANRIYKVKRGETLFAISRKLGMNVNDLRNRNHLSKNTKIRPGQILRY